MDEYRSCENPVLSHQVQIVDTVRDYGFLAPRFLAREEEMAHLLQESALWGEIAATAPAARQRPVLDVARSRLGAMLIRIGARLQGPPTCGEVPAEHQAPWLAAIAEAP